MPRQSAVFLYVIVLLSTAFMLPNAKTNIINDKTSITIENSVHECTQWRLARERPLVEDCVGAVAKLPSLPQEAYFHDDVTVWDDYQLPVWRTNGTCEIYVHLASSVYHELSSWKAVNEATRELINLCIGNIRLEERRHTGGWMTVGHYQGIIVSIINPLDNGGVGNVIVTSATRDS
ncbi:hypothetical protein N7G274_001015 [Stereocaulon virgatum]|uniref:Ecp2 effector protein domain-containing protein n=1 Tax=Stereocaulon virgatum TaxID=373712 RepID=A0ABR4AQE5_9LECA